MKIIGSVSRCLGLNSSAAIHELHDLWQVSQLFCGQVSLSVSWVPPCKITEDRKLSGSW